MAKKSLIKKYGLIFGLSCLAVIMMMVKLSYKNKDWSQEIAESQVVSPTPEPTVTPMPTIAIKQIEDYSLWQKLPYSGKGFIIDRYIDGKTVVVQPKGLDKKIITKEVWKWFDDNNVATEEMKIKWE